MIVASRRVGLLALVQAIGQHMGGLMRWDFTDPIEIAGGEASVAQASLGNSFSDLNSRKATPVEEAEQTQPTPQEIPPIEDIAERTDPVNATAPTENFVEQTEHVDAASPAEVFVETTEPLDTTAPRPTQELTEVERPTEVIETESPTSPTDRVALATAPAPLPDVATTPDGTVALLRPKAPAVETAEPASPPTPSLEVKTALTPKVPLSAVPTTTAEPKPVEAAQSEIVTAEDADPKNLTQSLRPKARTRPPVEKPVERRPPQPTTSASAGNNAQTNATTGQRNADQNTMRNRQTSGAASSKQAGNAAVSNYPGLVARKIQRVRRPRMSSRGVTQVAFRVADNGGLSSLRVSQSSGSNRLYDAALKIIRRAVPFPTPPPGAQRAYRIRIEFK